MKRRYSTAELMEAIIDVSNATAYGFDKLRAELTQELDRRFQEAQHAMNKRFDSVDVRFDRIERRLEALEQQRA